MSDSYPVHDYEPVTPPRRDSPRDEDEEAAVGGELNARGGGRTRARGARVKEGEAGAGRERTNATRKEKLLRRGHAISFIGVLLFTFVLLFRPYELVSALSSLTTMAQWLAVATLLVYFPTQLALEGNLTARLREVNLVLLLCVFGLLSIPLARVPSEAWNTFNDTFIKAVLIFIVMVNVVRTERRLHALIYVALGVTLMLSLGALNDYRAGNFVVEGYRIKGMIGGLFGNPNDLALHLVTMTPLAVAMMLKSRNTLAKAAFGALAVLTVAANVVTFSRGGFLGLMAAVFVLMWKLGRKHRFRVVVVGTVALVLFAAFAPGEYGIRILSIFVPGLDPVGSSSHRQGILIRSIIVSLRNPLTGIGMGNFPAVSLGETVSHNAYTQVAAEMGFAALVVYTLFILSPLRRLRRMERETFDARRASHFYHLAVGLQASIVGYMISSFFSSVAYQWYIYYLVAYSVCLHRIYEAGGGAAGETEDEKAERGESLGRALWN